MSDVQEQIKDLLSHPDKLLEVKPFTRGVRPDIALDVFTGRDMVSVNEMVKGRMSDIKKIEVTQDQFLMELDPFCHKVMFDENIPSITMKLANGGYADIEYARMPVSFQKNIKKKQVQHLTGNPMQFTLMNSNPDDKEVADFVTIKQYWAERNQDGMKTKLADAQLSYGIGGLLYYFDHKGEIKSRILSYADGYVLCPHNDDNGDRILESVYYVNGDSEYIDSYDDTYRYRMVRTSSERLKAKDGEGGWELVSTDAHGFDEIPLITKRGDVAWNDVQGIIDVYEVIYNVFLVIQKRHGWGILYVKGKFKDQGKKIAGSVVLNDTSIDGKGSADFKTPPSPQNMIETLQVMEEAIQKCSSTTFLLPKDIKTSGDISALAIMLTQSLDLENASNKVIEYQNVADKMVRLFKQGLAKELVNKGIMKTAATDFKKVKINAKFKVWRPRNDYEYNNMLISLKAAGGISEQTLIEKNTESTPDEVCRIKNEAEDETSVTENNKTTILNKTEINDAN